MSEAGHFGPDPAPAPSADAEPAWTPPLRVLCDSPAVGVALVHDLAPHGPAAHLRDLLALSRIEDSGAAAEFAVVFGSSDMQKLAKRPGLRVGALVLVVEEYQEMLLRAARLLADRLGTEVVFVRLAEDPAALARWLEYTAASAVQLGSIEAVAQAERAAERHIHSYAQTVLERPERVSDFDQWRWKHLSEGEIEYQTDAPEMTGGAPELAGDAPEPADEAAATGGDAPPGAEPPSTGGDAPPGAEPPSTRVLEAAIGGAHSPVPKAFRAGADVAVDIWVGDGRGPGIQARTPEGELAAIEDDDLVEGAAAEIVMWTTGGEMQREGVRILPDRTSTKASFEVSVPQGAKDFVLNVALILRGRIAQSGVIRGPVTPTGRASRRRGVGPVEFVVGPELADFGKAGDGDAAGALTLIEDGRRVYEFAPAANDSAEALFERPISGIELDRFAAHLGTAIDLLVNMQSDAGKADWFPSAKGARAFSELARIGHDAFLALVESFANPDPARLSAVVDSPFVHLATFETGEGTVALELLYDRLQPDRNAAWCDGFAEALDTGVCPVCAPWSPDAVYDGPVPVCPAGFWGVRKRIERVPHETETAEEASISNHSIARGEAIAGLDNLCVGVSDRVDGATVGSGSARATDRMLELIADALGDAPVLVREWKTWEEEVRSRSPQLLVLLTHTERQGLELGAADLVERARIMNSYVRTPFSDEAPGPIVLLLGCDTATTTGLHSFVQTFRNRGASIVVGTMGTTFGRFAAPIAGELVALLNDPDGSESVGATLTALRRRTLKRGWVTGLLVTAFSDASHPISRKD